MTFGSWIRASVFTEGGGIDSRHPFGGNLISTALSGGMFGGANWGAEYKESLQHLFTHSCSFDGHTTSLPLSTNNVTLDPTVKDVWGPTCDTGNLQRASR